MNINSIFGDLLKVAENVLPMVVPGAAPAIAAAKAIKRAIETARGSGELSAEQDAEAVQTLSALEARVVGHADRTASSLS